ncbi:MULTISPECIES: hypothetical protein [unclassified Agreia]|uniref:hypothetical protein n=1 Tax=unclassified Agreia TaxID=2641148 RepID=UPI0012E2DEE7|nr:MULTISPECIES: hypothetical protein [unclassified Agreia]
MTAPKTPSFSRTFTFGTPSYDHVKVLVRQLKDLGYYPSSLIPQTINGSPGPVHAMATYEGISKYNDDRWSLDVALWPMRDPHPDEPSDEIEAALILANRAPSPPYESSLTGLVPVGTSSIITFANLVNGAGGMSRGLFLDAANKAIVFVRSQIVDHKHDAPF